MDEGERIAELEEARRELVHAADMAIQDLTTHIKQLEEALKPFSNLAEIYDPECNGHFSDDYRVLVTLGMCRQARSALSPSEARAGGCG